MSSLNSPVRSLQKPVRPRGRRQSGTKQITAPPATAGPGVGSQMEELAVAVRMWRVVSTRRPCLPPPLQERRARDVSPDMTPPLGKVSQPSGHDLASRAPHTLAETGIHLPWNWHTSWCEFPAHGLLIYPIPVPRHWGDLKRLAH